MSRRNPFREIERMVERMQEQLEEEFGDSLPPGPGSEPSFRSEPPVDVEDRGDEYVLTVDLPGFDREDVDVELLEDSLRVEADREEATGTGTEEGHYVRRERRRQSVSRTISLPGPVDAEAASATFSNGVLTVTLPKQGEGDGHEIDIE